LETDQQKTERKPIRPREEMSQKDSGGSFFGLCFACAHVASWLVIGIFAIILPSIAALQTGLADPFISNYAQKAFQNVVGDNSSSRVDHTVLRLTGDGRLAVEARDVEFTQLQQGMSPMSNDSGNASGESDNQSPAISMVIAKTQMKLDPIDLAFGKANISAVEISDIAITFAKQTSSEAKSFKLPKLEIIETVIETAFTSLDRIENMQALKGVDEITASNIEISHPALDKFGGLIITTIEVVKKDGAIIGLNGAALLGDEKIVITANQSRIGNRRVLKANLSEIKVDLETQEPVEEYRSGLKTSITTEIEMVQGSDSIKPTISLKLNLESGALKMGGEETPLNRSVLNFAYDADKKSIELKPSRVGIAQSVFPLSGGVIDAANFEDGMDTGLVFDLLVNNGRLAPTDTSESAVDFGAKIFGYFDPSAQELNVQELTVTTDDNYAAGNAVIRFKPGISPELNIGMNVPRIKTAVAKQFWPFWLGRGTRLWAANSIYGGELSNVRLWFHVDAGRFSNPIRPIHHKVEDFQVDYDFKDARVNIVGDIPPVRGASGHMTLRGEKVVVRIDEGASYFPSNRKMDIVDGQVLIANTNDIPLMAEVDLNLTGWADAAAELISFKPIDALDEIGIKANEISGLVDARVKARFGIIESQSPPDPVWDVQMALNGVDLAVPIEGYTLTNITGDLDVNSTRAILKAKMKADGVAITAQVTEPVQNSGIKAARVLSGNLTAKDRIKLGLDIEDIVFGPTSIKAISLNDSQDNVTVNLKNTKIIVPGTGWVKAKGIPASANFIYTKKGNTADITDFKFSGSGFLASGSMIVDKTGIRSANFDRVKLAPKDDYNLKLTRKSGNYFITVGGTSFDMRPLITELTESDSKPRKSIKSEPNYDISGSVGTVFGFGGEALTKANIKYKEQNSIPRLAEFTGRTRQGGSVAARLVGTTKGEKITVASDDSGSFWRFFDIYAFVQGGSLDLVLEQDGSGPHTGNVLIRDFKVIGDERLKTLVSARANAKERSLNDALKNRLDVSRITFDQAVIEVEMGDGVLRVKDGIVRGAQIGAAFSGILYDKKDNTDMAGTFMPAYALNRFFGEIPILGALLGNGKDKALLGITFRVSGNSSDPRVQVNPLSVIAPGIFRAIF
jgi:hypothetical protein